MNKNIKLILFASLIFVSININTIAQTWSADQLDVWAGVEKYWEVSSTGNSDAFLSYFDESYNGWSYNSTVPMSKSNTSKWIKNDFKNNSNVMYTLTPITIWVKGDFAYVNYFYAQVEKNKDGKENPSSGKWTDILMKKGNKWVLVGDHGGRTSKSSN